jgi:hypothetical protein
VIIDRPNYTPAQIRELSEKWYARQLEVLALIHGKQWPEHRKWLEEYLKEELRQRLREIGWRPRK